MKHYRIVTIDYDGKLSQHRGFVCDNDDDAIVWAKQLVDEAPVKLWSGGSFCRSSRTAIQYKGPIGARDSRFSSIVSLLTLIT